RVLVRDLPVFARGQRLRRRAADPARHHRRPRPIASEGLTVDLELSDEQVWLEESINTLLERHSPPAQEAWQADEAQRAGIWDSFVEFGVLGGVDGQLGRVALCLVARAIGCHLA